MNDFNRVYGNSNKLLLLPLFLAALFIITSVFSYFLLQTTTKNTQDITVTLKEIAKESSALLQINSKKRKVIQNYLFTSEEDNIQLVKIYDYEANRVINDLASHIFDSEQRGLLSQIHSDQARLTSLFLQLSNINKSNPKNDVQISSLKAQLLTLEDKIDISANRLQALVWRHMDLGGKSIQTQLESNTYITQAAYGFTFFVGLLIAVLLAKNIAAHDKENKLQSQILADSESKFRTLYDNAPDMYISVNPASGSLILCNETVLDVTGFSREELMGKPLIEMYHQDCLEDFERAFKTFKKVGKLKNEELSIRLKDGSKLEISLNAEAVRDSSGDILYSLSSWRDISEFKAIQKQLKAQKVAMDEHSLVSITDVAGKITYVNDKFCSISGYSREELIGANHRLLNSNAEPYDYWRKMFLRVSKGLIWHDQVCNKSKSGDLYWVDTTIVPLLNNQDQLEGYTSIRTDVTQSRLTQDYLMDAQNKTQQLINELKETKLAIDEHSIVATTDIKGTITYVNDKFCEISGYSKDELVGANHRLLNSANQPEDYWRDMFLIVSKGGVWHDEVRNKAKDGHYYWVDTTIVPVYWDTRRAAANKDKDKDKNKNKNKNNIKGYIAIRTDISSQKEQAKALANAKVDADAAAIAKTQFLSTMSHEIRTPMNGVIGMVQLLEDTELSNEQQDYLSVISSSGDNLLTIINDILDFSKLEANMVESESIPFDLERVCQESLKLIVSNLKNNNLEFIFDYHPDCPRYFKGDPSRIRQVLINLFSNAIKFTAEGFVRLGVSCVHDGEKEHLRFEVQDTGIGLKPEVLNTLFDEFTQADTTTTRKYGGTGLGLAITKKIVNLFGWEIGIDSVFGEGTTFWINGTLEKGDTPKLINNSSLEGIKVLFIDDSKENRTVYKAMIEHMGAKVSLLSSPHNVLETLTEEMRNNAPYKIVILDHNMPDITGLELGNSIRKDKQFADLKMLIFSSVGVKGDAKVAEEIGFNGYLNKLTRYETLQSVLSAMLDDSSSSIITHHTIKESREVLKNVQFKFKGNILLVEDILANQMVAAKFLKKMGLNVQVASNGQEALECFDKNKYDLVFMDCRMPVMDGYDATRAIRSSEGSKRYTPIIALTANASIEDKLICKNAGMDDVVVKPYKSQELANCLKKWLPDNIV